MYGPIFSFHGAEVMPVMQHADLHAIPLLVIHHVCFAPDVITHAGRAMRSPS
jgi:hypothetical protein